MITVQLDPNQPREFIKYPWVGIHRNTTGGVDTIVLFTSEKSGVCLQSGEPHKFGIYSTGWIEKNFTIYDGSINISKQELIWRELED